MGVADRGSASDRRVLMGVALLALGLAGCARAPGSVSPARGEGAGQPAPETGHAANTGNFTRAVQLYFAGEAAFAEGAPDEAVAIWRHALLELPQDPENDPRRHALVLRMGHALGVAYLATGDEKRLDAAETLLERYLERHEALFADDPDKAHQREEIYALLGDIAVARAPEPQDAPQAGSTTRGTEAPSGAARDRVVDAHAGEQLGQEVRRNVVVVDGRRVSVDDLETRMRLRSSFGDPFQAGVMTKSRNFERSPRRPLVRLRRWARDADRPRRARISSREILALVGSARPQLERCYSAAFSRRPDDLVDMVVELDLAADRPRAAIVDGELIDPRGDSCLIDAMASAAEGVTTSAGTIRIDLRFFWQAPAVVEGVSGLLPSFASNPALVSSNADYDMPTGWGP